MSNINDPGRSMSARALRGNTVGGASGLDPVLESEYWSENWSSRPYVRADLGYSYYEPAYRFGWESRVRYAGHRWEDVEGNLMKEWSAKQGDSRSTWDEVKAAVRDAWDRVRH